MEPDDLTWEMLEEHTSPLRAGDATGTTQIVLRRLVMVVGALGFAIRNLSGADRGQLKGIDAELTEIGQLLGLFPGETVEKPASAWPEGVATSGGPDPDEGSAETIEGR